MRTKISEQGNIIHIVLYEKHAITSIWSVQKILY